MTAGGRRCGNDPRAQLSPEDRAAVAEFQQYLAARRAAERPIVRDEVAGEPGRHQWTRAGEDRFGCPACGVTATRQRSARCEPWTEYRMPSGWTWHAPDGSGSAPPCPPPAVEALCPWDWRSMRYAGAKGDDQFDTALRTWCDVHECAVSECPEPGPWCPGAPAHEDGTPGRPGPCTGREQTCRCMCPACCGDTPDMYGYDGDH